MHFSRMYLNPQRRAARELLGDPHGMHKAVLSCFPPDGNEGGPGRVQWRVDREAERVALYVVSPTVPSFEHLQESAGWANQKSWDTADYVPLLRRLDTAQRFNFRLTANPVHTLTENGKKRRVPHVTADHQLRWLLERQKEIGVHFPKLPSGGASEVDVSVRVTGRERIQFRRRDGRVTLVRVTYQGVLEVRDALKLQSALINGVGKAKGYGCGLLTLSKLGAA